MSWLVTGAEKVPVDKLGIGSVSLLLHGNGAIGSTTITDSSPTPKTVTAVGNAQISTAQSKFGGSSIAFDGNGDYLAISRIALTGDFTIEFFVRLNSASNDAVVATGDSIFYQLVRLNENGVAGKISAYIGFGYVFNAVTSGIAVNTWNHVALVRSGVTFYLFVEGQQLAVNASPATEARGPLSLNLIGAGNTGGYLALNGFIDEFRCSNVARYTSNFTPPTAPFPDI